jgi:sporulation integral membrane protein YlbJ
MGKRSGISWGDAAGGALTVAACVLLLWDPENAIKGGLQGLKIFGEAVLPSLLPFFVVAEILIGLGLVHYVGALVEPLMRPVFNVPGVGSFVWSMGLAAGYPMDAVITARLRRTGDCTRIEGERLLAFTNTADPLFILGAVAVGMLGMPTLGVYLAAAHYLSAISVGIVFRYYGGNDPERAQLAHKRRESGKTDGYWANAKNEMEKARKQDGRPFGRLLAESMQNSTLTLLKIGGFIMFFAAVIELMNSTDLMRLIGLPLDWLLRLIGWERSLTAGTMAGILELDVGSAMLATAPAPLLQRLTLISAVIGWSGLSVHGQVASIVSTTDLRLGSYVKARLLHALLAALYVLGLCTLRPPAIGTATGALGTFVFMPFFRAALAGGFMGLTVVGGYLCHRKRAIAVKRR